MGLSHLRGLEQVEVGGGVDDRRPLRCRRSNAEVADACPKEIEAHPVPGPHGLPHKEGQNIGLIFFFFGEVGVRQGLERGAPCKMVRHGPFDIDIVVQGNRCILPDQSVYLNDSTAGPRFPGPDPRRRRGLSRELNDLPFGESQLRHVVRVKPRDALQRITRVGFLNLQDYLHCCPFCLVWI